MRLLLAEEEEKFQAEESKRGQAASRIQAYWKKYRVRVVKDINY
jgi:hypothetical protein